MLSGLPKKEQKNSALMSSKNIDVQSNSDDSSWKETSEDIVTVGCKQFMSHQERYEFVKNRSYSAVKPSPTSSSNQRKH
ncbi:hypothetical protein UH38_15690 [Aliterella atlantica CENA595]|uniref:Uncharacterized protein n=1 Tax=Aliterella atlantica CENA595 TaxID=1618023 RepID=A0A0D8ZPV3_9CYAN|nr:hypothetical protein UH38_15690 [Aliterella atlantica CENA595]